MSAPDRGDWTQRQRNSSIDAMKLIASISLAAEATAALADADKAFEPELRIIIDGLNFAMAAAGRLAELLEARLATAKEEWGAEAIDGA